MYYPRVEQYELTPKEKAVFSLDTVGVMLDPETGAGAVINHPSNQFLAGNLLRTRRNPEFDKEQPISTTNRPLTTWFTDDPNAELSNVIAGNRIDEEARTMSAKLGYLTILASQVAILARDKTIDKQQIQEALSVVAEQDVRVRNKRKVDARINMVRAITLLESRGGQAPHFAHNRLRDAAESLSKRQAQLARQQHTNKERKEMLRRERATDRIARMALNRMLSSEGTIADHEEDFLHFAKDRFFKPGNLTVNNAWLHRHEENSLWRLYVAQSGFEPLYGFLMKPMSQLAHETSGHYSSDYREAKEFLLVKYAGKLVALETIIKSADIGGDYTPLTDRLAEIVSDTETLLMSGKTAQAISYAKKYRELLRYRALLGRNGKGRDPEAMIEQARLAWYGGLPNIKSGFEPRPLPPEIAEDPFKGL